MRRNWIRISFMIVGLALSYLLNNLPVVPDHKKPWVLPGVLVLTIGAAWLTTKDDHPVPQPQPLIETKDKDLIPKTQVEDIAVTGKRNEMIIEEKSAVRNLKIDGDENKFDIGGSRSNGGKNP